MRYYYEDPLAVAWMIKHFSMEFALTQAHRRYIHPDSEHLLRPQLEDLVKWKKSKHHPCEYTIDEGIIRVYDKIIQRNGIAFHWPLTE